MPFRVTDDINTWVLGLLEEEFDASDEIADKTALIHLYLGIGVDCHGTEVLRTYVSEILESAIRRSPTSSILYLAILNTIDFQMVRRTFLEWAAAALEEEDDEDAVTCVARIRAAL